MHSHNDYNYNDYKYRRISIQSIKLSHTKYNRCLFFIIKKNHKELKYQNIMNIYHINSNRQLLNSYLKCLSVIVS